MTQSLYLGISLALAGGGNAAAATSDANFSESLYASVGSQVTGIAWAPDGSNRLFAIRKTGEIMIVKNGATLPTPFAIVSPVITSSECGLIGICFDPDFISNGSVYVFATVSASEQQIIRYTAVGDTGTSKTVLIPGLPTRGANHDGGSLGIGPDGKLYWSIGDLGNGTGVDADLTSLASKIGRANLDGTLASGNPFDDGAGPNNNFIWARGFRNPFAMAFQPATGALWVDVAGTSYEQIFLVERGNHAGWNDYENTQPAGYITPKIKYRTNGTDNRGLAAVNGAVRSANTVTFTTIVAHGFRPGEKITISGVTDPSFNGSFYVTSVPGNNMFTVAQAGADATSGGGSAATQLLGGAVVGGCFLDTTGVPSSYRGNYFFGDYNSGRLMRVTLDDSNQVNSVDFFVSGLVNTIDAATGPDGALYYAVYNGTIYRLAYTNYTAQQIVATPANLRMIEGGLGAFAVRLAQAPAGTVQVNLGLSGDADISLVSAGTLAFEPGNWSVPQVVQVAAAVDGDLVEDHAAIQLSATGIPSETVAVFAADVQGSFTVGPVTRVAGPGLTPLSIGLSGRTWDTYVLEASTNLMQPWVPISTVTLTGSSTNIEDPDSTTLLQRYYRARLAP